MDISQKKQIARKQASAIRKQASLLDDGRAPEHIFLKLKNMGILSAGKSIAGFLPIGSEIDTRPILAACRDLGMEISLPCVEAEEAPLKFRLWHPNDVLVKEKFGTSAPSEKATEIIPDIILAPMLAFDRQGYRLGYGGGFYDRSLVKVRKIKDVSVIGVAYSAQEVETVPANELDQPLDAIITEKEVIAL